MRPEVAACAQHPLTNTDVISGLGRSTPGTAWGAMTPMRGAETPGTPGWGNDFNPGTGGPPVCTTRFRQPNSGARTISCAFASSQTLQHTAAQSGLRYMRCHTWKALCSSHAGTDPVGSPQHLMRTVCGAGGFSSSPTDYPTPASQYGTPGTAAATPGTATPAFSPVGASLSEVHC